VGIVNITEHGYWTSYKPTSRMLTAMPWMERAICAQNANGEDWYDYNKTLQSGPVYATAFGSAQYEPDMLFPGGALLIQIDGYTGSSLEKDLWHKEYDREAGTIKDPPEPPPPPENPELTELKKTVENMKKQLAELTAKR
jgi:hypothetical protein